MTAESGCGITAESGCGITAEGGCGITADGGCGITAESGCGITAEGDCGITADLIVGFPGETGDEFAQTLEFIKKAAFSDMHIFPFSPRPGTKAADMPEQIEKSVKRERARMAAESASQSADRFKRAQIGKTARVLFEQEKNGYSIGHSSNYLEIAVKDKAEKNSLHNVWITNLRNNLLLGEITMEKERCIQNGRKS